MGSPNLRPDAGIVYVTYGTQQFYTYTFIDPSRTAAPVLWALFWGMVLGHVIFFVLVEYGIWFRLKIMERKRDELGRIGANRMGRGVG
jgi:hypothetical protein